MQLPSTAANLKPCVWACQRTPKLDSLRVCCQGGGRVAGKEVPLVGTAQPGAGCRRTSHSSGQSQSVTKTNVGRRTLSQAKDNNEYFSLLADAFVLAANAEVRLRKAIVLTKMCVSKCLHKTTREGQANSKGNGALESGGFSGIPPFPGSLLASDLTALNQFS